MKISLIKLTIASVCIAQKNDGSLRNDVRLHFSLDEDNLNINHCRELEQDKAHVNKMKFREYNTYYNSDLEFENLDYTKFTNFTHERFRKISEAFTSIFNEIEDTQPLLLLVHFYDTFDLPLEQGKNPQGIKILSNNSFKQFIEPLEATFSDYKNHAKVLQTIRRILFSNFEPEFIDENPFQDIDFMNINFLQYLEKIKAEKEDLSDKIKELYDSNIIESLKRKISNLMNIQNGQYQNIGQDMQFSELKLHLQKIFDEYLFKQESLSTDETKNIDQNFSNNNIAFTIENYLHMFMRYNQFFESILQSKAGSLDSSSLNNEFLIAKLTETVDYLAIHYFIYSLRENTNRLENHFIDSLSKDNMDFLSQLSSYFSDSSSALFNMLFTITRNNYAKYFNKIYLYLKDKKPNIVFNNPQTIECQLSNVNSGAQLIEKIRNFLERTAIKFPETNAEDTDNELLNPPKNEYSLSNQNNQLDDNTDRHQTSLHENHLSSTNIKKTDTDHQFTRPSSIWSYKSVKYGIIAVTLVLLVLFFFKFMNESLNGKK